jgi:hypothetical protein
MVLLVSNYTITATEKEIPLDQDIDNFKLLDFSLVKSDMTFPTGTAAIVSPARFKNTTYNQPLIINFDIDSGYYIAAYYVNDTKFKLYATQNITTGIRIAVLGMN